MSYWTAAWSASAQGPYPYGRETAQPDLTSVFPNPLQGAYDQSFRMIVRPDIWGSETRIRFSNFHGSNSVTFDDVFIGLQDMSSAVLRGTNQPVTFSNEKVVKIPGGEHFLSDPIHLGFLSGYNNSVLSSKSLAVSFHVCGETGPMTYHAKALQTSYLSAPGTGSLGSSERESSFPYSTTSWFFVDAIDMKMPVKTRVVVAFGDSISDGSGSTINGFDRWPDVLSRRLHEKYGNSVSLINQGIGGNQVLGPNKSTPLGERLGGVSALSRLERDVISMSGITTVIWLEGINDFGHAKANSEEVIKGISQGITRLREGIPGIRIVLGTLTPALNATTGGHGTKAVDVNRRAFNEFVRSTSLVDGFIDFDAVTVDPSSGELRSEMRPGSSIGGLGDGLHPNRLGYQAMAAAVSLDTIIGN